MTQYSYGTQHQKTEGVIVLVHKEEVALLHENGLFIEPMLDKYIYELREKEQFIGNANQVAIIPTFGHTEADVVILAGYRQSSDLNDIRQLFSTIAAKIKEQKLNSVTIDLKDSSFQALLNSIGVEKAVQAMIEGLQLALYERTVTKKEPQHFYELQGIHFVINEQQQHLQPEYALGVLVAEQLVQGVKLARDLTNMPGNELTPERLAFFAEELAAEQGLDIEVLDEWSLAEEGMGGILGVGQGSVNPPRMIVIHYDGDPASEEKWGLIGKGITFDTGGISLKPGAGMEEMISDMGGAAAVLGAMKAIAALQVKANIVAVIPTAENMPSDRALKPGDVIRTMSGYTVEVINTDAEGRLVLADGMTTAIKRGATKLVDLATLTGAVLVALGTEATGAITNNDALMNEVLAASLETGERVWQLPAYSEYKKQIQSDVADLKNTGGRNAGTITGGLFIGHFAEDKPWVHLDIAGTAYIKSARKWEPKGATGVMVRTLYALIAENSNKTID